MKTDEFKLTTDLESTEEDQTIAWAENNGWEVRLMSYRGRRSCADAFFFGFGRIIPIEFKRKGGKRSGGQIREHARMAKVGVFIPTFDNSAEAVAYLRGFMS